MVLVSTSSREGERDKQALLYYNIIVANINEDFDRELKMIRKQLVELKEDDKSRKSLYERIDELSEEKDALINRA